MKTITKTLSGPGQKLYNAEYHEAESLEEVGNVITSAGLSLEDVNFGLRIAKRALYTAALDTTVDSKLQNAIAAMVAIGIDPEQAKTMAEAQRSKIDNGLPTGLTAKLDESGNQLVGSRGRKKAA